jgi:hypothetical protein
MIVPEFDKNRIASPDAVGKVFTHFNPLLKVADKAIEKNRKAKNQQIINKQKADAKATAKAEKEAAKSGKSTSTKKTSTKPAFTYKGRKPTAAAVQRQNAAAKTYVTRKPRGGSLTPAQAKQNEAAKTYMTKTSVPGQSGAAKGRPDTKAAQKTAGPGVNKMPKATVNKTGARNVRKTTTVTKVTKTPAVKPPAAPGRRTNGAPKKRMR